MDYTLTSLKQCDDFVCDDVYIALCSGYVDMCCLYDRKCVWKCGVMVVIREFAYIEQVYILNI